MGMINTNEIKSGSKLIFSSEPYSTISSDFVKPGKGAAFYKIKVQNLLTGNVLEKTLRSGEKVESADVMDTDMEYLYFDGNAYVFMDSKSYEQISIQPDSLGKDSELLQENLSCMVTLWNGQAIAVKLPNTITAVITYTEPAIKGDTQSRVLKEATIDTGATVQVPTFIDIGERITVDTRSRQYLSRVNK